MLSYTVTSENNNGLVCNFDKYQNLVDKNKNILIVYFWVINSGLNTETFRIRGCTTGLADSEPCTDPLKIGYYNSEIVSGKSYAPKTVKVESIIMKYSGTGTGILTTLVGGTGTVTKTFQYSNAVDKKFFLRVFFDNSLVKLSYIQFNMKRKIIFLKF